MTDDRRTGTGAPPAELPDWAVRRDPADYKVRGVAPVPDALSVPRWPPPRWPLVPRPSIVFESLSPRTPEAEVGDAAEPPKDRVVAVPPLRVGAPPGPAVRSGTEEIGGDVRTSVPERLKRLGRRAALPAVTAAVAAFVVATGYLAVAGRTAGPVGDLGRWGSPGTTAATETTALSRPAGDPFGSVTATVRGAPTRLRIAAIGLDSPLETLRLGADGALQAPRRFGQAGWYADGTVPGDTGPAVIAGHVDSKAGPAVFYRLREIATGDRIDVVRGGTVVRFTVVRTAWYPKRDFPTTQVYGPTPDRQLRLITCGGVFDRRLRSYRENLVVYAVAG